MTGADIVGTLLLADLAVTARVAPANMKLGKLPDNVPLPALLIRTVSSIEAQPLKRGGTIRTVDRVSVAVRAATYRDQVEIIRLVRKSCAGKTGNIGGGSRVAIGTAGAGPDMNGPGNSFEQTQDFRVSFDATT